MTCTFGHFAAPAGPERTIQQRVCNGCALCPPAAPFLVFYPCAATLWMPACAGMTKDGGPGGLRHFRPFDRLGSPLCLRRGGQSAVGLPAGADRPAGIDRQVDAGDGVGGGGDEEQDRLRHFPPARSAARAACRPGSARSPGHCRLLPASGACAAGQILTVTDLRSVNASTPSSPLSRPQPDWP